MNFLELVNLVRDGYREASLPYKKARDATLVKLPVFAHFLELLPRYPDRLTSLSSSRVEGHLAAPALHADMLSFSPHSALPMDRVVLELGCGCGTQWWWWWWWWWW